MAKAAGPIRELDRTLVAARTAMETATATMNEVRELLEKINRLFSEKQALTVKNETLPDHLL